MEKPKTSLIQSPLGIGARNIFKFHCLTRNGISLRTLFFQVGVLYAPKFIYNILIHLICPSVCDTTFCYKSIFYVSTAEPATRKSIVVWIAWLARSLWSPFLVCGDKQGRVGAGQGKAARATAARGRTRCHFY